MYMYERVREYQGTNFNFSFDPLEKEFSIEELATGETKTFHLNQDDYNALYVCVMENDEYANE